MAAKGRRKKSSTAAAPGGRRGEVARLVGIVEVIRTLAELGLISQDSDRLNDNKERDETFATLGDKWGVPALVAQWMLEGEVFPAPTIEHVAAVASWDHFADVGRITRARHGE